MSITSVCRLRKFNSGYETDDSDIDQSQLEEVVDTASSENKILNCHLKIFTGFD